MTSVTAPPQITPASSGRVGRFSNLRSFLTSQETILALVIFALCVIVAVYETGVLGREDSRFLRERNVLDVLTNASYIAVAALGMSLVIISGNIDISVGSLIGVLATLSGTLAINAEAGGYPMWFAFVAPLIGGVVAGAITGFLVAYLRIPSIVVTLGMFSILKGGLIIFTGGEWIYNLPEGYALAQERLAGIPIPIVAMVVLVIAVSFVMRYTALGRAIYAVGGSAEAARLSGISERRTLMMVFMLNGLMVGVASVIFATKFNAIQSTVPEGVELLIITAAVVGGVSILGGVGTVIGAMLGSILIHVIRSGMQFTNISDYWIQAVQGLLILITVLVDLLRRRRQMNG